MHQPFWSFSRGAPGTERKAGTFDSSDTEFLNTIGEIIIPETDTPGAAYVNTGAFAVAMLEDCYPDEARARVISFLSNVIEGFDQLTPEEQSARISQIDAAVYSSVGQENPDHYEGYKIIKVLTLLGYFTSEAGMTEALDYVEVSGKYEGCIDLKPGQKAWA